MNDEITRAIPSLCRTYSDKVFTPLRVTLASAKIPAGRDLGRMLRKHILRT